MKRLLTVLYPYLICIVAGTALFVFGSILSGEAKSLVLGIAGAFFAIPCLYVIYESAQRFSNRRLNKELFDYAKMRIDREILSMVNQLMKMIHPYDQQDSSFKGIQVFLSQNYQQIVKTIEGNEYLGFQVLKEWEVTENNLVQILESPFILQKLNNDQVIAIMTIMKQIRSLQDIHKKVPNLYESTNKESQSYKVHSGIELNQSNSRYPDRYLLLKHFSSDNYMVTDYGDFPFYQVTKLLHFFRVDKKYIQAYAHEIYDAIAAINHWIELTGTELLIDTKMFRLGNRPNHPADIKKEDI